MYFLEVTPCVQVGGLWVLELFHGPTFSFKDIALQFLGNLFEYLLSTPREGDPTFLTVLGATSGDTGSAAIHGLSGKENINCFILYPSGKISQMQEKQMTTVIEDNVFCLSVQVKIMLILIHWTFSRATLMMLKQL